MDTLTITLAALADPTRRAMLAQLASGPATVGELAEPHPISLPAISRHLKVLQRAGLVTQGRQGQWRPCALRAEPLAEVDAFVDAFREYFGDRLDRLAAALAPTTPALAPTTTAATTSEETS